MRKWFVIFLLVFFTIGSSIFTLDDIQPKIEKVENGLLPPIPIKDRFKWNIYERMKHHKVPGVSVAVINNFKIEWAKGYGVLDKETNDPVTEMTLFQAASISKPVAAIAALRMVQEGKLSLYEDINNKLVTWKLPSNDFTAKKKVMLKHLLNHSGGITVHGFRGYAVNEEVPTLAQLLDGKSPANSAPIRVDMLPGLRFRYAGGGYCIVQQTMIDIEKRTFPEIMRETVLEPLEMNNSTYEQPLPPEKISHAAAGYRPDGNLVEGKRHTYPEMAAAGLWTTPSDLARFAIEIQLSLKNKSNRVLSKELMDEMLSPFVSPTGGLGLFLQKREDAVYFNHGGANEGFRCYLIAHKDKGYGAAIMANSDNGGALYTEILRSIAAEYDWDNFLPKEVEIIEMAPDRMEVYKGRYLINLDEVKTVTTDKGSLFVEGTYDRKVEVFPVAEDEFIGPEAGAMFTFALDDNDSATGLKIKIGRRIQKAKRILDDYVAPYEYVLRENHAKALEAYRKIQTDKPKHVLIAEERLNNLGYGLLRQKEYDKAISLFKINIELYPDSANTYDSLAETYMEKGDKKNAIKYYEIVLEKIPADPRPDKEFLKSLKTNAEAMLKKLK
ncbi:MAG: serine hydrolase [Candidatus Aminicenantes bacterium]|nr:MAG: serine hydrolase [Candidatus Aminicenantes bacterium]